VSPEVKATIHRTSVVAAVIGAVLSPIPLADEIVLMPVFAVMTRSIARQHALPKGRVPWKPILGTAAAGLGARAAVAVTVSYIPGVAAVTNAASAALLTELFGQYVDVACAAPEEARVLSMKQMLEAMRERFRERPIRAPKWWPWRKAEPDEKVTQAAPEQPPVPA
jgi:uncharacterized protein (DUF697 family)